MANYLDFLVALDEHIRHSSLGKVTYGTELHEIARQAGLVTGADQSAAYWTGELVADGYLTHSPLGLGDRRPLVPGHYTPDDLSRVSDYRITPIGRAEADRLRRQRREELTDAALGARLADLVEPSMSEPQRQAIGVPFRHLRSALDNEHYEGAIGAAKDLLEAALKVAIERAGEPAPRGGSLPGLLKEALRATGRAEGAEIARSLAATVQRLAELRNAVGSGHGRAAQPTVSAREARLAASAACGVSSFVLDLGD